MLRKYKLYYYIDFTEHQNVSSNCCHRTKNENCLVSRGLQNRICIPCKCMVTQNGIDCQSKSRYSNGIKINVYTLEILFENNSLYCLSMHSNSWKPIDIVYIGNMLNIHSFSVCENPS